MSTEDVSVAEQNAVACELRRALGYSGLPETPLPVTPSLALALVEVSIAASEVFRLRDALQHVEHALGDRLKPGQTPERAIADLFADLGRVTDEIIALRTEVVVWATQPNDDATLARWQQADRDFGDWITADVPGEPPDVLTMVMAVLFDHRNARTYWREHLRAGKAERERDEARTEVKRLTALVEEQRPQPVGALDEAAQERATAGYAFICLQGPTRCSPRGHKTQRAAERCAGRLNAGLRAIGMLDDTTRWVAGLLTPAVPAAAE